MPKRQILMLPSTGANPILSVPVAVSGSSPLSYKQWRNSSKSSAPKSCAERPLLTPLSPKWNFLKPPSSPPPWLSSAAAAPCLPGLSPLACPDPPAPMQPEDFYQPSFLRDTTLHLCERRCYWSWWALSGWCSGLLRPVYCQNRIALLWSLCNPWPAKLRREAERWAQWLEPG